MGDGVMGDGVMTREEAYEHQFREDKRLGQQVEAKCPFCKGRFWTPEPNRHEFHYVVHTMPMCERYDTLDPLEFLSAARRAMGVHMPWDDEN